MGRSGHLDLVGTFEAHLILGVERSRIARWLDETSRGKDDKIPKPAARLKCGPIWRRGDIDKHLRKLARREGVSAEDFAEWSWRRSLKRAEALGMSESDLLDVVGNRPSSSIAA